VISVDTSSPVPPFEQVRAGLVAEIHEGILVVGTRLPTVRGLAADLGIAPNTVARAYRELESAGLVETRGRGGTVVAGGVDAVVKEAHLAASAFAQRMRELGIPQTDALTYVRASLSAPPASAH
jgi:DNA-binding transcriptional regulator YhcF (GntR family)